MYTRFIVTALVAAVHVIAQGTSAGAGKYPARMFSDPGLPKHTFYAPKEIPAGFKTPILVWGEGGCINSGAVMKSFLLQLASQGVTVIANGPMSATGGGGFTQTLGTNMMKAALDWVETKTSTPQYSHLDMTRVAAAGQSCGGLEAAVMAYDKRVKTIGMFNQGGTDANKKGLPVPNGGDVPDGSKFNVPTFFFAGGPSDNAGQNGAKDYEKMPKGVPAWLGNYASRGHGGTYGETNGGTYGVVGSNWLKFVFFGDKEAGEFFKTDKAAALGWTGLKSKNLELLPVS